MRLCCWVVVLFVVACTPASTEPGASSAPAAAPSETPAPPVAAATPSPAASAAPTAGMANPASKHCIDNGGSLQIHKEPEGEYGVCVFSDGSRCEEWRYLRGTCAPGQCREPSGRCAP